MKPTSITGLSGSRSGPLSCKQVAFKLDKTIGIVPIMTQDKLNGVLSNPAKWWPGDYGKSPGSSFQLQDLASLTAEMTMQYNAI